MIVLGNPNSTPSPTLEAQRYAIEVRRRALESELASTQEMWNAGLGAIGTLGQAGAQAIGQMAGAKVKAAEIQYNDRVRQQQHDWQAQLMDKQIKAVNDRQIYHETGYQPEEIINLADGLGITPMEARRSLAQQRLQQQSALEYEQRWGSPPPRVSVDNVGVARVQGQEVYAPGPVSDLESSPPDEFDQYLGDLSAKQKREFFMRQNFEWQLSPDDQARVQNLSAAMSKVRSDPRLKDEDRRQFMSYYQREMDSIHPIQVPRKQPAVPIAVQMAQQGVRLDKVLAASGDEPLPGSERYWVTYDRDGKPRVNEIKDLTAEKKKKSDNGELFTLQEQKAAEDTLRMQYPTADISEPTYYSALQKQLVLGRALRSGAPMPPVGGQPAAPQQAPQGASPETPQPPQDPRSQLVPLPRDAKIPNPTPEWILSPQGAATVVDRAPRVVGNLAAIIGADKVPSARDFSELPQLANLPEEQRKMAAEYLTAVQDAMLPHLDVPKKPDLKSADFGNMIPGRLYRDLKVERDGRIQVIPFVRYLGNERMSVVEQQQPQ